MSKLKNRVLIIPDTLKDQSLKVKFSYLSLRNLVYYVDKGLRTQTKNVKQVHDTTIKNIIENYLECSKDNNILTDDERDLIKSCFTTANKSLIVKNDYILGVEKELTFKPFTFYCNCMIELSFHIGNDYFNDDYIKDTVLEMAKKMLVDVNETFIEFIILDVNNTITALSSM